MRDDAKRDDGMCSACVEKKAVTRDGCFCLRCLRQRLREESPDIKSPASSWLMFRKLFAFSYRPLES